MSTCTTCQEMPSCIEGLDRYSLQDDNYLFVLTCPPGFDCNAFVGTVTLICCDGTELSATIPAGANSVVRAAILQGMLNEAGRRLAFCDPPVIPDPPGDPTIDDTDPGTPGTPGTPVVLYYNRPQSWTLYCPDGTPFVYTVPAGRFIGFNQDTVDGLAVNAARAGAAAHRFCLGPLLDICCGDTAFNETITVFGPGVTDAHAWSVVSGALPTGLTLPSGWVPGHQATLSGIPTVGGTFAFTIRSTATDGHSITRAYTICVVEISPATLPDATVDEEYSETLTAPSCATGPLSWQITAGALPAGLTLDEETGVISGIPTEDGDFTFTVTVQTEAT